MRRPASKGREGHAAGARDRFVHFFLAGAEQASTTEYEAGIPQALRLMNSRVVGQPGRAAAIRRAGGEAGRGGREAVPGDALPPADRRTKARSSHRTSRRPRQPAEAYGDILWALLNSSEFAMVR